MGPSGDKLPSVMVSPLYFIALGHLLEVSGEIMLRVAGGVSTGAFAPVDVGQRIWKRRK